MKVKLFGQQNDVHIDMNFALQQAAHFTHTGGYFIAVVVFLVQTKYHLWYLNDASLSTERSIIYYFFA